MHPSRAPTLNPSPPLPAAPGMAMVAASCAALQHAAFAAVPAPRRQRGAARLHVAAQASSSGTSVSGVPDKLKPDWTGELRLAREMWVQQQASRPSHGSSLQGELPLALLQRRGPASALKRCTLPAAPVGCRP